MNYTTIAIIYNPNSTGSGETLARELKEQLHDRLPRQKVELITTKHAGHGEELAYSIASSSKNPLIISSSGDGGYNDVVNGVMRAYAKGLRATTGLLPAGNANDHHRNLHQDELIDQIVRGTSRTIDLLKITATSKGKRIHRYAHSYIGFGFTPIIGSELNRATLNRLNEIWIVTKSLFMVKPVQLKIGGKARAYESVVFSNIDAMSKYLKISQPSSVTDGKFEVTIFRRRSKLKLIMVLLKSSFGMVKEDQQVREFSLQTVNKTLVQADGEIMTLDAKTSVRITIEKRALACII